jgi:membrane-associated phospholipid phosphatase
MRNYPSSAWAWGAPAVAAVLLGAIAASGSNHSLFLALNHAGHRLGDNFWSDLTMLGDGAVALALIVPCIRRSPRVFWAALIAAVIATLYVQVIKHVINVPRPLAVFEPAVFYETGPPHRAGSFPSGHAAASFALAGIWVMALTRRVLLRLGLLVLAVLVSLSRVMVGVHWPLDLLGGMLGGWFAAWCGLALATRHDWKTSSVWGLVAGMFLLVVAGALLFSPHIGMPVVMPLQRALGLVCLLWGGWEMLQTPYQFPLRRRPREERGG